MSPTFVVSMKVRSIPSSSRKSLSWTSASQLGRGDKLCVWCGVVVVVVVVGGWWLVVGVCGREARKGMGGGGGGGGGGGREGERERRRGNGGDLLTELSFI